MFQNPPAVSLWFSSWALSIRRRPQSKTPAFHGKCRPISTSVAVVSRKAPKLLTSCVSFIYLVLIAFTQEQGASGIQTRVAYWHPPNAACLHPAHPGDRKPKQVRRGGGSAGARVGIGGVAGAGALWYIQGTYGANSESPAAKSPAAAYSPCAYQAARPLQQARRGSLCKHFADHDGQLHMS